MTSPNKSPDVNVEKLIAELVLLESQATRGPWRNDNDYRIYAPDPGGFQGESMLVETKHNNFVGADCAFIAAFRNSWDQLVRGFDALKAERDQAEATLDAMTTHFEGAAAKNVAACRRITSLEKVAEAGVKLIAHYTNPMTDSVSDIVLERRLDDLDEALCLYGLGEGEP